MSAIDDLHRLLWRKWKGDKKKHRIPTADEVLAASYDEDTGSFLTTTVGSTGSSSIFTLPYDRVEATYPNDTTEVYTTYLDNAIQETVTVTYTDSSKQFLDEAVRS